MGQKYADGVTLAVKIAPKLLNNLIDGLGNALGRDFNCQPRLVTQISFERGDKIAIGPLYELQIVKVICSSIVRSDSLEVLLLQFLQLIKIPLITS